MKKLLTWFTSIILLTCLIGGYCFGVGYMANIFAFFICVQFIANCIVVNVGRTKEKMLQTYRDDEHMPKWADVIFYTTCVLVLVGAGHFILGAMTLISACCDCSYRQEVENEGKLSSDSNGQ